jgi:hypothetical protein
MPFSPDYFTARERFRAAAHQLRCETEQIPVKPAGPAREELTTDMAVLNHGGTKSTLLVSSGLHGCEGLFGSAVQLAALERWARVPPPDGVRVVLVHALNPYGFSWMRRTNEDNVDLNRNFLLPGEKYEGAAPLYRDLDPLLNPPRLPARWEPFRLKAYLFIARHGLHALMQAIAEGQYEFPKGLFYGGSGPSETMRMLQEHLPHWLEGSERVMHLDLHTGLGRWGAYKLLTDYPLGDRAARLRGHFGDAVEESASQQTAYRTRGSFGQWCLAMFPDKDYTYFCAEFGTYAPLQVLAGLRAENQTHHWGKPETPTTRRAREHLRELLNPASPAWRQQVLGNAMTLIGQAVQALLTP